MIRTVFIYLINIFMIKYMSFSIISSASFYLYGILFSKISSSTANIHHEKSITQTSFINIDFERFESNKFKTMLVTDQNIINNLCILFNGLPNEVNNINNVEIFELIDDDLIQIGSPIYQIISNDSGDSKFIIFRNYSTINSDNKVHTQNDLFLPLVHIKKYYCYIDNQLASEQICLKINK